MQPLHMGCARPHGAFMRIAVAESSVAPHLPNPLHPRMRRLFFPATRLGIQRSIRYDQPKPALTPAANPPAPQIDPKLLQFGDKVGEGEFGIVYRASYLGTPVAVKVLKDNDAVALGDFRWGGRQLEGRVCAAG
jgi:hypothetical protein